MIRIRIIAHRPPRPGPPASRRSTAPCCCAVSCRVASGSPTQAQSSPYGSPFTNLHRGPYILIAKNRRFGSKRHHVSYAFRVRGSLGEGIPGCIPRLLPGPIRRLIPKPVGELIPGLIGGSIPKPIGEPIPELIGELLPRSIGELVPEPIGELIPELIGRLFPGLIGEPIPGPIGRPIPPLTPTAVGPPGVSARQRPDGLHQTPPAARRVRADCAALDCSRHDVITVSR
jgi:hypothetical protein